MDTMNDKFNTLNMIYFFRGLNHAIQLKWFSLDTFNPRIFESLENFIGNMNWILPGKIDYKL